MCGFVANLTRRTIRREKVGERSSVVLKELDYFLRWVTSGSAPVYLVKMSAKFDHETDSSHTLSITYVDYAGE
jgi:hypothetical protein